MTGRSGGRHEIDVLAEKSDPLTSFRIAVECKAWHAPVEKDVVSKLHYVMNDLGIHKGLVVSLAGVRSGAQTAAAELGIDVWGPEELRHHLGDSVFADVADTVPARGVGHLALGWPFRTAAADAERRIRDEGNGRFGLRTLEPITWFAPLWLPAHITRLTVAQPQNKRLRKQQITSIGVTNLYDALSGTFLSHLAGQPVELPLGDVVALKPLQRTSQLQGSLRKAVEARQKVSAPSAIERHDANLRRFGLPLPCVGVTVDGTDLVYLPVFAGLLQAQGQDRLVAVNGVDGSFAPSLSHVLTSQLAHVRRSFGAP